jgi:hypothetical protein
MAQSANLLTLLADDIKLSLLERQRSVSLGLESDAQNGNIARSLESMREGIEALEAEAARVEGKADGYVYRRTLSPIPPLTPPAPPTPIATTPNDYEPATTT